MRVMHTELIDESLTQTVVELTASRDGRHFSRVGNRDILIPLGDADQWDPHCHGPTSRPILVGDELWIYYFSAPVLDPKKVGVEKARAAQISRIGLATIRRDGYVSMDAGDEAGRLVTRPLTFNGQSLHVNARVQRGGYLKAELQTIEGESVMDYQLAQCDPVTGDVMSACISWGQKKLLRRPVDESLRLVFALKNAKLYSFWIE